jgi:aerobic carbon-monoxide dehydrogenase small subunit
MGGAALTIGFILNGEDVSVKADPEERLSRILKESFGLRSVKSGCGFGRCGSCLVFLGGDLVSSCLVPAFKARGTEVVTLEGYSLTEEYRDIARGFDQAGVETCGYCLSGKILSTEALLSRKNQPTDEEIKSALSSVECRCTEVAGLVAGVKMAAQYRQKRIYGRGK